jgi:molybdenum cofactor cytidylyltransferase
MLADQALLQADSLKGLISAWRQQPDRIAAACYAGSLGAPAIFPQRLFPDLLGLRGDRGAKQILRVRAQEVTGIVMPDAEFDLDTKTDLKQLREMEARSAAKQEIDPASELQVLETRRSIRVRDAHRAPTLQTRYTCPFDFQ